MTTYALPELITRVRDRLTADALAADPPTAPIPVTFGWREPSIKRETSHRIVFVAGDDSGWSLGSTGAPESPGVGLARPLAALDEVWTCYLDAEDVLAPDDEAAQYVAARSLYDAWYRAVYLARIKFSILSQRWVVDHTVRYAGAVLRITGTVSARIPDAPSTIAPSDTGAALTVHELDVSETISIPPPDEA